MLYSVLVEFHKDFVSVNGTEIIVGVKSRPVNGAVNKEIIKKLSKYFNVTTTSIVIRSGHKSSRKIIEIL